MLNHPLVIAIVGGIATSFFVVPFTVIITNWQQKPEYNISTTSCSETGPTQVWLRNVESGYEVRLPDVHPSNMLKRVTRINNSGSKTIESGAINIYTESRDGSILESMVFLPSQSDEHKITAADEGRITRIDIKDFNPGDNIYLITISKQVVDPAIFGKVKGATINFRSNSNDSCPIFGIGTYSGTIAFRYLAPECEPKEGLNLRCKLTDSFITPKDFPPGQAQVLYR